MRDPEQYMEDESYQELIQTAQRQAAKQAERTDAGRRKQILMANRPFVGPPKDFKPDIKEDFKNYFDIKVKELK